jgi:hypothetical protein
MTNSRLVCFKLIEDKIFEETDINSIAFAVFHEEDEHGYFLGYFPTMKKARELTELCFRYFGRELEGKEKEDLLEYFVLAKRYSIDNTSYYSQYLNGDLMGSNGTQNMIVKRVDRHSFNLDLFLYERLRYVNLIKKEQWDKMSEFHQELFGRMIAN